jgi:peroxin-2
MTSSNFAAAQKRVLERRRLREVESRAQLAEQQRGLRVNTATLEKLPYPLRRLPDSWLFLWNSVNGREGTRPAFRVGQVDAELLDEELLALLKGQVGEALKYFDVRTPCGSDGIYSPMTDFDLTAPCARRLVS